MDSRLGLPRGGLTPGRRTYLSPLPPEEAGRHLDEAVNGPPQANPLLARSGSREFRGAVQGPSFWAMTRAGEYNPFERRAEGLLVPAAGSSEVRVELRPRPGAVATVVGSAGLVAAYTVVAVPLGIAAGGIPWLGGIAGALLISVAAALWVLLAAAVWAGRRLARQGEARTLEFLGSVLDAVDDDLL